jgi:hypothetical protein
VRIQAFTGIALYLFLPENVRLARCILLFLYCFFVRGVPLLVEAGYGCSRLVASNVFVRTKPYLLLWDARFTRQVPLHCGHQQGAVQCYQGFTFILQSHRTRTPIGLLATSILAIYSSRTTSKRSPNSEKPNFRLKAVESECEPVAIIPHSSYCSLAKTLNLQKVFKIDSYTSI